jgi:hypothetical protein
MLSWWFTQCDFTGHSKCLLTLLSRTRSTFVFHVMRPKPRGIIGAAPMMCREVRNEHNEEADC